MIVWGKVGGIVAAALMLLAAGYHFGRASVELTDARAEVKQDTAEQKKAAADESTVSKEAKTYEDAELAPIAAPVVRVCRYTPAAAVPSPNPAGSGAHAAAANPSPNPVPDQPGPDVGSALLRAAHLADAQVAQLQDYVVHVCQAKSP